jgi:hypothetical protein
MDVKVNKSLQATKRTSLLRYGVNNVNYSNEKFYSIEKRSFSAACGRIHKTFYEHLKIIFTIVLLCRVKDLNVL